MKSTKPVTKPKRKVKEDLCVIAPSMTRPNESYSIQELWAKMAKGMDIDIERPIQWIDEDDPILQVMRPDFDLTDRTLVENYVSEIIERSEKAMEEKTNISSSGQQTKAEQSEDKDESDSAPNPKGQ